MAVRRLCSGQGEARTTDRSAFRACTRRRLSTTIVLVTAVGVSTISLSVVAPVLSSSSWMEQVRIVGDGGGGGAPDGKISWCVVELQ
jgi:hypothetical protein